MPGYLDRCVWLATSTGTGNYVEAGAITGFQSMETAGALDQQSYDYVAQSSDLTQWEYGTGLWTAGTQTLARTTIRGNSSGTTAAINFTTVPQLLITKSANTERIISKGNFGGRLSLVTATSVMNSNQTAKTVVYYTAHLHDQVTCFDGNDLSLDTFPETNVTLDTTNFLLATLHDFFIFNLNGVPTLGYGPAWTNLTTRSAATALARDQGVQTNNISITLRTDSTHTYVVPANQAVYVGTCYATANGQTGCAFDLSGSGGALTTWGIFNAYNRVPIVIRSRDSAASWTYNSATWRPTNNSTSNAVRFIDGLGEVFIDAATSVFTDYNSATGVIMETGLNLNATTGSPTVHTSTRYRTTAAENGVQTALIADFFLPALGFNTVTAMESGDPNVAFFAGTPYQFTQVRVLI